MKLIFLACLIIVGFTVSDFATATKSTAPATVVQNFHTPSHIVWGYGQQQTSQHYPERWITVVRTNTGEVFSVRTPSKQWAQLQPGDAVTVIVARGGITNLVWDYSIQ